MLMGRLADVGMALRDQASLSALTDDVVAKGPYSQAKQAPLVERLMPSFRG